MCFKITHTDKNAFCMAFKMSRHKNGVLQTKIFIMKNILCTHYTHTYSLDKLLVFQICII